MSVSVAVPQGGDSDTGAQIFAAEKTPPQGAGGCHGDAGVTAQVAVQTGDWSVGVDKTLQERRWRPGGAGHRPDGRGPTV